MWLYDILIVFKKNKALNLMIPKNIYFTENGKCSILS